MQWSKRSRLQILLPCILLIILAVFCSPFIKVLSISSRGEPSNALLSKQAAVRGFVISYTHSVNKGRVHDFYACKGKRLVLEKTLFVSYGAGIPEAEESPGAVFTVTDEGYEISGLDREIDQLLMAVGLIAKHSIALRMNSKNKEKAAGRQAEQQEKTGSSQNHDCGFGKEYPLENCFEKQSSILLKIRRVSLLRYLAAKKLPL